MKNQNPVGKLDVESFILSGDFNLGVMDNGDPEFVLRRVPNLELKDNAKFYLQQADGLIRGDSVTAYQPKWMQVEPSNGGMSNFETVEMGPLNVVINGPYTFNEKMQALAIRAYARSQRTGFNNEDPYDRALSDISLVFKLSGLIDETLEVGSENQLYRTVEAALTIIFRNTKSDKTRIDALDKRAHTRIMLEKGADAVSDMEGVINLDESNPLHHLKLGSTHYFEGNFEQAIDAFTDALAYGVNRKEFDPFQQAYTHIMLAASYNRRGTEDEEMYEEMYEQAHLQLNRLEKLGVEKIRLNNFEKLEILYERSRAYMGQQRFDEARDVLDGALRLPDCVDVSYALMGETYRLEGNTGVAEHFYRLAEDVIKRLPEDSGETSPSRYIVDNGLRLLGKEEKSTLETNLNEVKSLAKTCISRTNAA